jgi:hypothetical protein
MSKTPEEIKAVIEQEIGGDWSRSNLHGCDLHRCLVEPVKRQYENSFKKGEELTLWLVLEECPEEPDTGYKIVFDEETGDFGLVTSGAFIGFYGTFLKTFESM